MTKVYRDLGETYTEVSALCMLILNIFISGSITVNSVSIRHWKFSATFFSGRLFTRWHRNSVLAQWQHGDILTPNFGVKHEKWTPYSIYHQNFNGSSSFGSSSPGSLISCLTSLIILIYISIVNLENFTNIERTLMPNFTCNRCRGLSVIINFN